MRNENRFLSHTKAAQRGAATLVITLIVLVAMVLGLVAVIGTSTMETRMTANDQRSRQAIQAAQAGVDYLLAALSTSKPDRTFICADTSQYNFELDFSVAQACPAPAGATYTKAERDKCCQSLPFEILTRIDRLRSRGYSPDGESVRVIESSIDVTTPWNWSPAAGIWPGGSGGAPIVSQKNVDMSGGPDVGKCELANCKTIAGANGNPKPDLYSKDGQLVLAGGVITPPNASKGYDLGKNFVGGDSDLAGMSEAAFFEKYTNTSREAFNKAAFTYTPSGGKSGDSVAAAAGDLGVGGTTSGNQFIRVSGDLQLNTGQLGTPERPVLLVVDGNLSFKGNVDIWGVVYAKTGDFSAGNVKIMGGFLSPNDIDLRGTAAVISNPGLIPNPNGFDPASLLANAGTKEASARIGSWRELSLPAAK